MGLCEVHMPYEAISKNSNFKLFSLSLKLSVFEMVLGIRFKSFWDYWGVYGGIYCELNFDLSQMIVPSFNIIALR